MSITGCRAAMTVADATVVFFSAVEEQHRRQAEGDATRRRRTKGGTAVPPAPQIVDPAVDSCSEQRAPESQLRARQPGANRYQIADRPQPRGNERCSDRGQGVLGERSPRATGADGDRPGS